MDGHHLDAIMASLENFHILNLVYRPVLHFVFAENWGVILVEDPPRLVDDDQLDLASMHKDYSKNQDDEGNEILPPIALSVALEQHSVLPKS